MAAFFGSSAAASGAEAEAPAAGVPAGGDVAAFSARPSFFLRRLALRSCSNRSSRASLASWRWRACSAWRFSWSRARHSFLAKR